MDGARGLSQLRLLLGELARPTCIVYNETKAYPFRADENNEPKSDGEKITSIFRVSCAAASKPPQSLSEDLDVFAITLSSLGALDATMA